MNARIKKLEAAIKRLQVNEIPYTVFFRDGEERVVSFFEALRLCSLDESVVDVSSPVENGKDFVNLNDITGVSLLRAIIGVDSDFSDLPELDGDGVNDHRRTEPDLSSKAGNQDEQAAYPGTQG